MKQDGYGSFGANAVKYGIARQVFPEKIFSYLKERAGKRTNVLDMGCGTGIPSRQLADHGFIVTGSDIDKRMIEQAKIDSKDFNIKYVISPLGKLPFNDRFFDIVTAFSAFHWFCDGESLSEIKRVLNNKGLLFIVNKNETGDIKKIIKNTLKPFISELPKDAKKDYNPAIILKEWGFNDIQEYVVLVTEEYTIEDALLYAQTMSVWNFVKENNHEEVLQALRDIFVSIAQNGIVMRPLEVKVVSGFKF
ncbi:MAG: class I SAM-dependent methyltransferase [bacterium]|nr:class I SAM-dependent methyltransferase [bacterium]